MLDAISRLSAALEGRYRVERELGEGGMATVYLAEDLKHERLVALKVLKPELAAVVGAGRFLAEIKTTANLQHPHILPLHDSGEVDGLLYYVMPYVKGESLRDRLGRERQLPVDDAVRIATNMAEALDYAHRQGVIHRDIKPANVLLLDGKPVISDFGIALAVSAGGGGRLTETGLSLGTPHYMSPEQATGDQSVGPATDIYALGCVLYEMLVGEPPFTGSTPQAVLGKIITGEAPSARAERRSVPANVDAVIAKALEKVPADRFGSARVMVGALVDAGYRNGSSTSSRGAGAAAWSPRSLIAGAAGGALAVGALMFGSGDVSRTETPLPGPLRFTTEALANNQRPFWDFEPGPSDMGIVYRPERGDGLWYRPWNEPVGAQIPGTENPGGYWVSPDGRTLVFGFPVQVMTLPDGVPRELPALPGSVAGIGSDGYVYFDDEGLSRLELSGGAPERLLSYEDGEVSHHFVTVLPGHRSLLMTVWAGDPESPVIQAIDLETMERSQVADGRWQYYAEPTGHIVYLTLDRRLMAAPFDVDRLELSGVPQQIATNVSDRGNSRESTHRLTIDGQLMYWEDSQSQNHHEFVWVDRAGTVEVVEPGWLIDPGGGSAGWSLSPGDSMVAWRETTEGIDNIWVKHLAGGAPYALTSDAVGNFKPRWFPDGSRVTYLAAGEQNRDLFEIDLSGIGAPTVLADYPEGLQEGGWTPSGEWVLARSGSGVGQTDIVGFRPATDEDPEPVLADPSYGESEPQLSPDGRWLAYVSDESGEDAVYVRPFPSVSENVWRISRGGGIQPRWSGDGSELFFVDPVSLVMLGANIDGSAGFRWTLNELFSLPDGVNWNARRDFYDVTEDGQRFLFARRADAEATLVVITNFFEELKRLPH